MGILVALLAVAAQTDDLKPLKDEAAKAARLTWANGSFHFGGRAMSEVGEEDGDEPTELTLAGDVAAPFNVALKVTAEKCTHEIFRKDKRMAGRSVWRGGAVDLGQAVGEILSLLDMQKLSAVLDKAKTAKALTDDKVGGVDCRALAFTLPGEAIRTYSEEEPGEEEESSVEAVDLKLWIAKTGGLVQKLEATNRRNYKNEDNPAESYKAHSSCTLTLTGHGSAKVTYPAEILKQFED